VSNRARIVVTRSSEFSDGAAAQRESLVWGPPSWSPRSRRCSWQAGSPRVSAQPLEARIAIGDLARQVNHDHQERPSRRCANVFRHFAQVGARRSPRDLPQVFAERQRTVESSISYLETLAANYAKLSPQSERKGPPT